MIGIKVENKGVLYSFRELMSELNAKRRNILYYICWMWVDYMLSRSKTHSSCSQWFLVKAELLVPTFWVRAFELVSSCLQSLRAWKKKESVLAKAQFMNVVHLSHLTKCLQTNI